jgi:hypothetical protein
MKVYCKKCTWLANNYYYGSIPDADRYVCTNPRFSKEIDTPLEIRNVYEDYRQLNHSNSCSGYNEKSKTFMEKLRDEYSGV